MIACAYFFLKFTKCNVCQINLGRDEKQQIIYRCVQCVTIPFEQKQSYK